MSETTTKSFLLTFDTDLGNEHTFRIGHADESRTGAQVRNSMQRILASGVIRARGNLLTGLNRALLETVTEYETLF